MILVNADGFVSRHAHDAQVDGIEGKLRQNSGENGRDTELGMQQPGA